MLLLLVDGQELALHRRAQLLQVIAPDRTAHRYTYPVAGLDQHAFVDRHADLAVGGRLVDQNARPQRRDTVEPMWEQAERALAVVAGDQRYVELEPVVRRISKGAAAEPVAPLVPEQAAVQAPGANA